MSGSFRRVPLLLTALVLSSGLALAQPAAPEAAKPESAKPAQAAPAAKKPAEFEPEVGQPGKDVIWVPTPQDLVDKMLDIAGLRPGDYLIDLGSGDGRTVITAAKRGVRALGIEYNPNMVALSQRNAEKEGVSKLATFVRGDIFRSDFSKATVVTMYLLPQINVKLRPTILRLRPGTRVVSHSFHMDEWEPDGTIGGNGNDCERFCSAYFWVVPARVNGTWRIRQGTLSVKQEFQTFTGTLRTRDGTHKVENGRLRGEAISFTAGGTKYSGTVKGRRMSVTVDPAAKAETAPAERAAQVPAKNQAR